MTKTHTTHTEIFFAEKTLHHPVIEKLSQQSICFKRHLEILKKMLTK